MPQAEFKEKVFYLESSNKFKFKAKSYFPQDQSPKAIVQIIHGMAEHMGRYHEFAAFLAGNGFAVYLHDHPGHGEDANEENRLGIVPSSRGWLMMLENTRALYTHIRKKKPEIPLFLMGHSMGSVLARHFLAVYPIYLKGLILSAPFETPYWLLRSSHLVIQLQSLFTGPTYRSKWFNNVFYNNFNRHYKNPPTRFEWISSDRAQVDEYANDPMCGFDLSNAFYSNLFRGIAAMKKSQQNLKYRKTLPVLVIGGQQDPVGKFGKVPIKVHQDFYKQKFQKLTVKVFKGRHELIHEVEKSQVFDYFINWMNECIAKKHIIV